MLKFSTEETVSLKKQFKLSFEPVYTKPEKLDDVYEINKCVEWIKSNNFQKVCLQFPDKLLPDSTEVILKLQSILNQTLYIIGDSAFESCCIDFISAEHINADAIIHFGPICFSYTTENIPYLNIYEKGDLNVERLRPSFKEKFKHHLNEITVLVDSPYIHRLGDIVSALKTCQNVLIQLVDDYPLVIENKIILFIGRNVRKLINIEFNFQPRMLYYFDGAMKRYEVCPSILKRRNYLIEKIKDSKTIGIVIGTLCVRNYLKIMERMKELITLSGKKYYLISVGKPTVTKLSNFPELDVYVVITCSLSDIYENRDFYRPIVTPFDIEIALNRSERLVPIEDVEDEEGDVSLITNTIRTTTLESASANVATDLSPAESQVALQTERLWRGLEQDLGQTEAELAQEGRSGIARKYKNEEGS
ncbi:hypothetical protein NQ314_003151 [Rhamnusium bicolor]|uniref:2-(3-amino-3-carboxypropyl)histidine synthase subunit 2 n=1 Tax=Rhamnusium bicolor TaxID=1586634 RepID=A0AAV8ZPG9_9CUCU|nr:hypothetical protein NQ314_003151 [Rhamnusium bicolor]